MNKIARFICNHNNGITVVTKDVYSAGCSKEYQMKYVECSRCGKILIESDTLEEYAGLGQPDD